MKQTLNFKQLWGLMLFLITMLVPQGAWAAQELRVENGQTVTISNDCKYDGIVVIHGGTLIIEEGASVSATETGYIIADGIVINYGTINGILVQDQCVFANHGTVTGIISTWDGGVIYNTGTFNTSDIYTTPCGHETCSEVNVEATCSHSGGKQTKCDVCYYIKSFVEVSAPLPHSFESHNGFNTCTFCGLNTYDVPQLKDGYYQIANAGNLIWFADKVNNDYANFKNANAKLTADIVVNDGTFADDGTFTATGASEPSTPIEWLIIGRFNEYPYGYGGTFDGQGHTISGLYANYSYSGLVGCSARECKIKNVGVINSYFAGMGVGGICGIANDNTEISNCYSNNVICKGSYVGGILGQSYFPDESIINCYSTASLIGVAYEDQVGGIAGELSGSTTNCYTSYGYVNGWSGTEPVNCEANVSLERFASGEIAYKLNGSTSDGTLAWYQKIGTDAAPVLVAAEGNTVYQGEVNNANFYVNENCTIPSLEIDNNNAFAAPVDFTATSVTFTRSIIKDGGKYSFIVPFDIPAEKAATLGKFYTYDKYEDETVYFAEETTGVKANTAYFFNPASSITSISLNNAEIKATTSMTDAANPVEFGLYGTYKKIAVPDGAYGYTSSAEGDKFVSAGTDSYVNAFRCYLWLGSGASASKANAIFGFDEATGINATKADYLDLNAPMYNLRGQRITSPQNGEIYIMGGKKVMFK